MAAIVNTVLGPVSVDDLGKTLVHEHFIFGYPGYAGDSTLGGFNYETASNDCIKAIEQIRAHGVKTVIDATPNDCGRDPKFLRDISEKTGLNIICATGYYNEDEGCSAYYKRFIRLSDGKKAIYEMFMKEITEGVGNTGIKPGVIKLASSYGEITDYEQIFFKAAAKAQIETGIPIITHTQGGTMGPEQAELLISEGADPNKIIIGHMCGNPNIEYQLKTLEHGVSIAYDRFGLAIFTPTDKIRCAILIAMINMGYGDKIILSHDKITYYLGRYNQPKLAVLCKEELANYRMTNIFENIIPHLKEKGLSSEQIRALTEYNISHVFGG